MAPNQFFSLFPNAGNAVKKVLFHGFRTLVAMEGYCEPMDFVLHSHEQEKQGGLGIDRENIAILVNQAFRLMLVVLE